MYVNYNDIINILPLVEGVMIDYHTREKYHTLEKEYFTRDEVEGDILFPECDILCKSVRRHVFVIVYLRQKTSSDKIRKKTLY
jgi:hypothetical protein